jgi:hypothetical protein
MEYMTMGSLGDLLLNESYPLEADVLLLMLRDIVQGVPVAQSNSAIAMVTVIVIFIVKIIT